MSEFLTLLPPQIALATLLAHVRPSNHVETVQTIDALHRTIAESIVAPFALPTFARSTVDGYAVKAADTHGAAASLPAYLNLIGEVLMGESPDFTLQKGECALIHTGGMLPDGADAVIMIEFTQTVSIGEIEIMKAVGHGENLLQIGDDVAQGATVIERGIRVRPAEIGGLMALGLDHVDVVARPRIAILSSGDELIAPGQPLTAAGQIYDVNSYTLRALIVEAGGEPVNYRIIPDNEMAFRAAAERALAENDVVLFTAGSSVSIRDLTAQTIDQLGKPGVLLHGVNVRPGKPTILAMCGGKPVIGLPGNPVSALVIARLFVVPLIQHLLGVEERPQPSITARLTVNLSSQSGREEWVAVRLHKRDDIYEADPVFGKSNLIFTLVRADGLLRIPPAATGIAAGTAVSVELMI